MRTHVSRVKAHTEIADRIYALTLVGDIVAEMQTPGQFVHVQTTGVHTTLLRRPLSIAAIYTQEQSFVLIYRVDGEGTANLSQKVIGDTIDVLGPLGNGFPLEHVEPSQHVLLIGGGIGVPPLYELSRQFVQKGVHVEHILGFAHKDDVYYEEAFAALGKTHVVTMDGSYGQQGVVTDVEPSEDFSVVYACGPTPMLQALEREYSDYEAYFSLEERMGCAMGVCMACVCHVPGDDTGTQYRKICRDGPVFAAGEVVL